jgi:DNA-nicking Smr family endonuclease
MSDPRDLDADTDAERPAIVIPITGELDLHAFAPADVVSVVREYLKECRSRGILEVRLAHGKGRGVQRASVRRLLLGLPEVAGFEDAPPNRGGWGATLVRLHRSSGF